MFERNRKPALVLVIAATLAAGCETGTGPEEPLSFDAEAALADHEALDAIFSSEALAGFRALGAGLSFQGIAPEADVSLRAGQLLGAPMDPTEARGFSGRLFTAVSAMSPSAPRTPIISVFRRGKTFVYDPDLDRYVMNEDLEGAPDNGVRFILYEPGIGGKPDPSAEIGHADLMDEGDGSAEDIALRLVVVEGTDTILEYATTVDHADETGKITVDGFLQGEQDRLDFEIGVRGSTAGAQNTVDISFEMAIASRSFLIQGAVSGVESESGEGGEVNLLVRHGNDSFQVDAAGTDTSIDGTVKLNGDLFAIITGDPEDPTITGATGEALTWNEALVLRQILDSTEDVFDFWEDLLDPLDELIILAIIL
jgi:hypothetical protein